MDAVCRTCLSLGELTPIFSSCDQHEQYTAVLFITTGLKIKLNDGLPQGICSNCVNLVNSTIKLRDQSHHAHQILLECGFKKAILSAERACNNLANIVGLSEISVNNVNYNNTDVINEIKKENKFDTSIDISAASHILERDCGYFFSVKNKQIGENIERVKRKYVRRVKKEETEAYVIVVTETGNNGNNDECGIKDESGNNGQFGNKTERVKRKYVRKLKKEETEALVLNDDIIEIGNNENKNEFGNKDEIGNNGESGNKTERVKYAGIVKEEEHIEEEEEHMEEDHTEAGMINDDVTEIGNNGKKKEIGNKNEFGSNDELGNDEFGNNANTGKNEDAKNKANREKQVETKRTDERITTQEEIKTKLYPKKIHRPTNIEIQKKYYDLAEGTYDPKGENKCSICKKIIKPCSSFVRHIQLHNGVKLVCDQCGLRFKTKDNLATHQMRRHGRERKLRCGWCDYRAVDQPQLTSHESRAHTGARPYSCDVCSASFSGKANIRQHMRVHFGVRSVQCDECPSMFTCRSSLNTHTARRHRMNYAYFCYLCPRVCTKLYSVRKHIARLHDIAMRLQGPIRSVKWAKNERAPPEVMNALVVKDEMKNI